MKSNLTHNPKKELFQVIFEHETGSQNFELIKRKGEAALFGNSGKEVESERAVKSNTFSKSLPAVLEKAKDFASAITIFNASKSAMKTEAAFMKEHVGNCLCVGKMLFDRGVVLKNSSTKKI